MTSASRVNISLAYEGNVPVPSNARVETLVTLILGSENIAWISVGVIFGSHEVVRNLNKNFLEHDYNTDVLSFLIDESDEGIEGEVYVDVETANERHSEFGVTVTDELERYVAHGVLHLAGFDDSTPVGKNAMRILEDKYLAALGG